MQSSSVMMGYRNNDAANKETFLPDTDGRGRWMRTGDVGMMSKAPSGNEHLIITERVKELIKVKVFPLLATHNTQARSPPKMAHVNSS